MILRNLSFQTVDARRTGVDVTGCVILLQFVPRLSKAGGHLLHECVGDAVVTLSTKLKAKSVGISGMMDRLVNLEGTPVMSLSNISDLFYDVWHAKKKYLSISESSHRRSN